MVEEGSCLELENQEVDNSHMDNARQYPAEYSLYNGQPTNPEEKETFELEAEFDRIVQENRTEKVMQIDSIDSAEVSEITHVEQHDIESHDPLSRDLFDELFRETEKEEAAEANCCADHLNRRVAGRNESKYNSEAQTLWSDRLLASTVLPMPDQIENMLPRYVDIKHQILLQCVHIVRLFSENWSKGHKIAARVHKRSRARSLHALSGDLIQTPNFPSQGFSAWEYRIGLIGCGLLGQALLRSLLTSGVAPKNIVVSTRRPNQLAKFAVDGVHCFFNNAQVFEKCNLVFICVLPHQVGLVAADARSNCGPHTALVSVLSCISLKKLEQLFKTDLVYRTRCIRAAERVNSNEPNVNEEHVCDLGRQFEHVQLGTFKASISNFEMASDWIGKLCRKTRSKFEERQREGFISSLVAGGGGDGARHQSQETDTISKRVGECEEE